MGDQGSSTYKQTKQGSSYLDRVVKKVLEDAGKPYHVLDFFPIGSDERQFSSIGFNLHVGSLMRTCYGKFPEYHTSADNLDFVKPESLADSLSKYKSILYIIENNVKCKNLNPNCEPQLGKYGLYNDIGGLKEIPEFKNSIFWLLNMSDGNHSLLEISEKSRIRFEVIKLAKDKLVEKNLLEEKGNVND